MLGLVDDIENHRMTPEFKNESDTIYYVGAPRKGLGGSEYLHTVHDLTTGDAPDIDLEFEARLQSTLLDAIQQKLVSAAHDISDGGLVTTLSEMTMFSGKGADISVNELGEDPYEVLYSEAQSGVVVTCGVEKKAQLESHLNNREIPFVELGSVTDTKSLMIDDLVSLSVDEMYDIYDNVIERAMKQKDDVVA
jgi:phosphoribosylformylglycinamidine synthase